MEPVWPQTTLEEVHRAQELADAGDDRYTWQINPPLSWQIGQHHPASAEIFPRFLEEELGWEDFLWTEVFAHPKGLEDGDVVYVRCAPGTNPVYPDDLEGAPCAPTIDEFHYETVKITVAQLARQDERGVWVVTGWEMIEPAEQVAPPSDAEIAVLLDAFLQARIRGAGAEKLAVLSEPPKNDPFADVRPTNEEIPLLYATSTGVPYERAGFEVVDGPRWPSGRMQIETRLLAEDGATVVEQVFSLESDRAGRPRLVHYFEPFLGPRVPSTTEDGNAVPLEYGFLEGAMTYRASYPLEPRRYGDGRRGWLAIVGRFPDGDVPRRVLVFLADPRPIGPGCSVGPAPPDAETLARNIGSDVDFEATDPVTVTIGGISALQMDVVLAGTRSCSFLEHAPFDGRDRARLYLLDLPEGSGNRILAIATATDEDSFETVLSLAGPIVDSVEFHAP